ncbi:MAG: HAMP domain-containing protein, partial [Bacteroidales bacterium]|nr:HAMP domain-containing protein [Bacteroidales bacterium]
MSRLYWKILAWFWCTLVLISVAMIWGIRIYIDSRPLPEHLPRTHVAALTLAFEAGNDERARNLLHQFNSESQVPIYVIDADGMEIFGRSVPTLVQSLLDEERLHRHLIISRVRSPGGETYQIFTPRPQLSLNTLPFQSQSLIPWLARIIAVCLSFLLCLWLARYLSAPIERLRNAARQLANGDLDVRIGDLQGRRDEIADLAADFDTMASRIQELIQGRQQLLRDISHELRSPLARLRVALALARRQGPDALDRIERDLLRLEELIGEVLSLSRLESRLDIPLDEEVHLSDLVEAIVTSNRLEADLKPCHLDAAIAPDIALPGNTELLHRAIENVLRNGIRYTAPGTTVRLSLVIVQKWILITVCDQGP